MHTPPTNEYFGLHPFPSPHRQPSTDIDATYKQRDHLVTNLASIQKQMVDVLTVCDGHLQTSSPESVGDQLHMALTKLADLIQQMAVQIEKSDDGCEGIVDHLMGELAKGTGDPNFSDHEDFDTWKASLLTLINQSPPLLHDVAHAVSTLTRDEAVEIADVSLGIGTVTVTLARYTLEKVDIEVSGS